MNKEGFNKVRFNSEFILKYSIFVLITELFFGIVLEKVVLFGIGVALYFIVYVILELFFPDIKWSSERRIEQ